jgi:CCR4-Not complex component, Not1
MERFVVHRPHPWGALVTFIELLRNPKYDFWNKNFVGAAPEVSLLLDSVGHSLSTPNQAHAARVLRLPDPSLYLNWTKVLLCPSVPSTSSSFPCFFHHALYCTRTCHCHPAFYDSGSIRITINTRTYSAYRSSYVPLMLPRRSTVIFPRAPPKSVNCETLGVDPPRKIRKNFYTPHSVFQMLLVCLLVFR